VVVAEAADPEAWNHRSQWRPSSAVSGSPGVDDPPPAAITPVLINEVLSRPEGPEQRDTVELYNHADQPADVVGWWLTDDFNTPAKYRLPAGSVVPANGYLTLDDSQFNRGDAAFGLGADGDEIWLFSANAAGELTGYVHGHRFGAAEAGVSFGRIVTSDGREEFVAQVSPTFGAANTGPRVGPVVISELMYHPPHSERADEGDAGEYVELLNASAGPAALYDPAAPTNTWRLRGGISFDFPGGVTLSAGEFVLLVRFDPSDAALAPAFRSRYTVPAAIRLFGPFSGGLNNAADSIELLKPTSLAADVVAYVLVDEVAFRDTAPWPPAADGTGASLQRPEPVAYGNDPAHWIAAAPTAGASNAPDLDRDGLADWWETKYFGGTAASADADADHDGLTNGEEYVAGTDPTDPSSYLGLDAGAPEHGVTLSFEAVPVRSYTLEFTDALGTGPWRKLADIPRRADRSLVTILDPTPTACRVYRLVTPQQP